VLGIIINIKIPVFGTTNNEGVDQPVSPFFVVSFRSAAPLHFRAFAPPRHFADIDVPEIRDPVFQLPVMQPASLHPGSQHGS